jgi:hypothetical protein
MELSNRNSVARIVHFSGRAITHCDAKLDFYGAIVGHEGL